VTHWKKLTVIFATLFLLLLGTFLFLYFYEGDPPDIDIIPRAEWKADEAKNKLAELDPIPGYYIICHTVTRECFNKVGKRLKLSNVVFNIKFKFLSMIAKKRLKIYRICI
jgi:hypothetical protein